MRFTEHANRTRDTMGHGDSEAAPTATTEVLRPVAFDLVRSIHTGLAGWRRQRKPGFVVDQPVAVLQAIGDEALGRASRLALVRELAAHLVERLRLAVAHDVARADDLDLPQPLGAGAAFLVARHVAMVRRISARAALRGGLGTLGELVAQLAETGEVLVEIGIAEHLLE